MDEAEARATLAAITIKDWITCARKAWIQLEESLTTEEQRIFWEFFDSQEQTVLKNRLIKGFKHARRELTWANTTSVDMRKRKV